MDGARLARIEKQVPQVVTPADSYPEQTPSPVTPLSVTQNAPVNSTNDIHNDETATAPNGANEIEYRLVFDKQPPTPPPV